MKELTVQIGVISHKPGPMLDRCLAAIVNQYSGMPFDIKVQIGRRKSNAENWNTLMDKCDADLVCILEDDTAPLKPFWLYSMVQTMNLNPNCAIVMPIETKDGKDPDPGFLQWVDKTQPVAATYGFCNLIRRKVGLKADEALTYFVDIDLSNQAISKGFSVICNGHVWMLHGDENGGRMSDDDRIKDLQARDTAYLEEKWKDFQTKGENGDHEQTKP